MRDFLDSPLSFVLAVSVFLSVVIGLITFAGHVHEENLIACYETVKDKSAYDMIMLCKGTR